MLSWTPHKGSVAPPHSAAHSSSMDGSEEQLVRLLAAASAGSLTQLQAESELLAAIEEQEQQLEAVEALLRAEPGNTQAAEVAAELAEALAATRQAHAACFPAAAGGGGCAAGAAEAAPAPAPAPAAAAVPLAGQGDGGAASYVPPGEHDFARLAAGHPPLARHLRLPAGGGRPSVDFTSWEATRELSAAILAVTHGVAWTLPEGQLVPPVPNRAAYITWLANLLALSAPPGGGPVRGLDIGCGASLIYPLLGAAMCGWHMVGVDVTDVALAAAQQLLAANPHLASLLEVRRSACTLGRLPAVAAAAQQQQQQRRRRHEQRSAEQAQQLVESDDEVPGPLAGALAAGPQGECFHFCMCNPPFFDSISEANSNPHTACGGSAAEMVVPGGELAFIRAMVADSLLLRGRIHWYSSMCGKKASLKTLRQELHAAGVSALRTTELIQGRTTRWAIAWSFAASPATANMPLPQSSRQQEKQQQQQQPVGLPPGKRPPSQQTQEQQQHSKRQQTQQRGSSGTLSFSVSAPASEGRKLVQALVALLGSVAGGQQVRLEAAAWRVSCLLPDALQAGEEQQPAQAAAGVPHPPGLPLVVSVYQQPRGQFSVVATAKPTAHWPGDAAAARLTAAVAAVAEQLSRLAWRVGDVQHGGVCIIGWWQLGPPASTACNAEVSRLCRRVKLAPPPHQRQWSL